MTKKRSSKIKYVYEGNITIHMNHYIYSFENPYSLVLSDMFYCKIKIVDKSFYLLFARL